VKLINSSTAKEAREKVKSTEWMHKTEKSLTDELELCAWNCCRFRQIRSDSRMGVPERSQIDRQKHVADVERRFDCQKLLLYVSLEKWRPGRQVGLEKLVALYDGETQ
jgi:hypothetical protein